MFLAYVEKQAIANRLPLSFEDVYNNLFKEVCLEMATGTSAFVRTCKFIYTGQFKSYPNIKK